MSRRWIFVALCAALLLLIAGVELWAVREGTVSLAQAWFPFVLSGLGALILALGPRRAPGIALTLLLAALATLFSEVDAFELASTDLPFGGPLLTRGLALVWTGLLSLFPFAFLHFSLVFPVAAKGIVAHPRRQFWIYAVYGLLLALTLAAPIAESIDSILLLAFPVGFLSGLVILFRQYRFSLTTSEQNRLRIILLGSVAGALPRFLTALGGELVPEQVSRAVELLLLIFPLSLVAAVVKDTFAEISLGTQKILVLLLVYSGIVNAFLLVEIAAGRLWPDWGSPLLRGAAALLAAVLVNYPLLRWGTGYVSRHFTAAEIPHRSQSSATASTAIEPNPFIAGNPIRDPDMFFGREEEFRFIRRKLENEKEGCAIVLCGERRTGKTSILCQILNGRLGDGFLPVFFDMQALVVDGAAQLLSAFGHGLASKTNTPSAADAEPSPVTGSGVFDSFGRAVGEAQQSAEPRRLLMLVDEYELIASKVRPQEAASVFGYLSSLLERPGAASFIFTGSRPLQAGTPWEPFLARSTYRDISYLARTDARDLIVEPLRGIASLQPGLEERLWRLAHGHPFFTQLAGQTLVDVLNDHETNIAVGSHLAQTVDRILENPPPQLLYSWSRYEAEQKLVLSALAAQLRDSQSFASPERVDRVVRALPQPHREVLSDYRVRMVLERLREQGVLDRDQTRFRFNMDLLRLWVRAERSIWNVLNELTGNSQP